MYVQRSGLPQVWMKQVFPLRDKRQQLRVIRPQHDGAAAQLGNASNPLTDEYRLHIQDVGAIESNSKQGQRFQRSSQKVSVPSLMKSIDLDQAADRDGG
jgi:hypothetical protein